jgi:zinc protease
VLQPGKTVAEAEKALIEEFEQLKREPVSAADLQRAKNQWARDYIISRESIQDKASHLAHAAVIHNDIATADGEFEIFMKVTTADIQRVAKTYFNDNNRVVLHVLPKGGGTQ